MRKFKALLLNPAWISFVWFGMTAGVSLLATPVRFSAPTVTRAIGLDIGRLVFGVLNRAELVALIIMLIVIRVSRRRARWLAIGGALALIVLAQSAWLLPQLAERAAMIVSGQEPPASYVHAVYSSLELTKLALLLVAGFIGLDEAAGTSPRT